MTGDDPATTGDDAVNVPDIDHYVYVLRCGDGTLYTGYTTDVERRVAEHRAGEGAKYTRGRTPVELVHVEGFDDRSAAMSREHEIKRRSRSRKLALVEGGGDPGESA
jgi:putative endonuclease